MEFHQRPTKKDSEFAELRSFPILVARSVLLNRRRCGSAGFEVTVSFAFLLRCLLVLCLDFALFSGTQGDSLSCLVTHRSHIQIFAHAN